MPPPYVNQIVKKKKICPTRHFITGFFLNSSQMKKKRKTQSNVHPVQELDFARFL